jgi:hypothetical protein
MAFTQPKDPYTPEKARDALIRLYKLYAINHLIEYEYLNKSLKEFLKNKQHEVAYTLLTQYLFLLKENQRIDNPKRIKQIEQMRKEDKSKNIDRFKTVVQLIDALEAKDTPLRNLQRFTKPFYETALLFLKDDSEVEEPSLVKRGFFDRKPQEKYQIYHAARQILNSTPAYQNDPETHIIAFTTRLPMVDLEKEKLAIQLALLLLEKIKKGERKDDSGEILLGEIEFIAAQKENLSVITRDIWKNTKEYLTKILSHKKMHFYANYFNSFSNYEYRDYASNVTANEEVKLTSVNASRPRLLVESIRSLSKMVNKMSEDETYIIPETIDEKEKKTEIEKAAEIEKNDAIMEKISVYLEQLADRLELKPEGSYPLPLKVAIAYLVGELQDLHDQYPNKTPYNDFHNFLKKYLKNLDELHSFSKLNYSMKLKRNMHAIFGMIIDLQSALATRLHEYQTLKKEKENTQLIRLEMQSMREVIDDLSSLTLNLVEEKGSENLKSLSKKLETKIEGKISLHTKTLFQEVLQTIETIQTMGVVKDEDKSLYSSVLLPRKSR